MSKPALSRLLLVAVACAGASFAASAQQPLPALSLATAPAAESSSVVAAAELPEAPGANPATLSPAAPGLLAGMSFAGQTGGVAGRHDFVVQPGQTAPSLSFGDKFVLGVKNMTNPINIPGWAIVGAYAYGTQNSPNYGYDGTPDSDKGAKSYLQRFGAAAARGGSETFISNSILAPLLHEDPRYYKRGSGHSFVSRVAYAATRPIIGKTDGGRLTPNIQGVGGDLLGSILTRAYYPGVNRNTTDVLRTWGGSVGGDVFVYLSAEFLGDIARGLHLTH